MSQSPQRPLVLHPLLFAVFPILFLYAQNTGEMLLSETILPIIIGVLLAALMTVFLGRLVNDYIKGGLITTLLYFFFFSFGHVMKALPVWDVNILGLEIGQGDILLIVWLVLLILFGILIFKTAQELGVLNKGLNLIGVVLIAVQVLQIGIALTSREETRQPSSDIVSSVTRPENPRDVYFIYLDGYGRGDILSQMYDYDNLNFLSFLREQGFYIADSSYANYCQTLLSAAATFNMDYINKLGDYNPSQKDRVPLIKRLWQNDVHGLFWEMGYSLVAFASGYGSTEFKGVDHYFSAAWTANEFQNILFATTPLALILEHFYSPYDIHRKRIENVLDNFSSDLGVASPKFVFAHIVCPHPPFVFGPNGEPLNPNREFSMSDGSHYYDIGGDSAAYRRGYLNQMRYVNHRMTTIIGDLLDRPPEQQPIIIIQGDHGPGSELSWVGAAKTNLKERFAILNASYYPERQYQGLYSSISPVNTFRVLFNTYFGASFELLSDRCFYSTWATPFAFTPASRDSGGIYENLLEFYLSRSPERIEYRHVTTPKMAGTPCDAKGCVMMTDNGLCIDLGKNYHSSRMEISIDNNDNYAVYYRHDSTILAMQNINAYLSEGSGLRIDTVKVPVKASADGFNNIFILPQGGDDLYGIGHIRLGTPRRH